MKKIFKKVINQFPLLTASAYRLVGKKIRGFDPSSARYCYSVWLRHFVMARRNGFEINGATIAELGPGDSFGVGLAALLSGANKYYALDVNRLVSSEKNIKIFDELVELFSNRENIPDEVEFSEIKPCLDSYDFPGDILTNELLNKSLEKNRISGIRNSLLNSKFNKRSRIQYFTPWNDLKILEKKSIDLILSQAVLEYLDNLPFAFEAMNFWVKPGGLISHTIDFRSHGTARKWNGHWTRSDFVWNWMKGRINRHPHSTYINFLKTYGFKIVTGIADTNEFGVKRDNLASRFKSLSDDDLTTSGAFIQAVKKGRIIPKENPGL